MKLFILSDTHGFHNQINIPKADIAIFCGDGSNKRNPYENELELRKFLEWYRVLPFEYKLFTPGNHDSSFYEGLIRKEEYPEITFLIHEQAKIKGLIFFGSPFVPVYGNWVYMKKRNRMDLIWKTIPNNVDILITHGPPKGILDLTREKDESLVQVGCKSLLNRVLEVKPILNLFGHIHDESGIFNRGIFKFNYTTFINASCLNHSSGIINQGIVYEI